MMDLPIFQLLIQCGMIANQALVIAFIMCLFYGDQLDLIDITWLKKIEGL